MTINAALLLYLVPVLVTDLKERRIPNHLLLASLILSFSMALWGHGHDAPSLWAGLSSWAGGLAVGLLSFLPLYALRLMGAGDVKLMATCGACLGPALAWQAALLALMLGGVMAVAWQMWFRLPSAVLWSPLTVGWTHQKDRPARTPATGHPLHATSARLPFSWPIWVASIAVAIAM